VIDINGKEYKVNQFKPGQKALWELHAKQTSMLLYDPLKIFQESISSYSELIQGLCLAAFVFNKRDLEIPDYYVLLAQNTLESARILVEMLTDCNPDEVNEDNKSKVIEDIFVEITDPELAKILEIRRKRSANPET
jgi:hypothetical protein